VTIKIYGSRGSAPNFTGNNTKYGGNTSCVLVETSGRPLVIDCGSGLAWFAREGRGNFDILLSHLHIDHIVGLGMFAPLWQEGNDIRLFTKSRDGRPLKEQVFGIFRPPYWPFDLSERVCAEVIAVEEDVPFSVCGNVVVTPFRLEHPNDTIGFRIDDLAAGKSVAYISDHEQIGDRGRSPVQGADVIIFDAAFLPEDYTTRKGFGHSDYLAGIKLAEESGCGRMVFFHLASNYSDEMIDKAVRDAGLPADKYMFAYDGMEIVI